MHKAFDISHECSLWQDLSMGTKLFDHVTLTLMFDLLIKNFNLGYNFQMICTRMLIFHMSVFCDKIFSWGTKICDLDLDV
jgi:hypothetical protein